MANGTRPVVLVLTLIVGLAIGWLIHSPAPTPPPPPPPPPPAATPTPVPTCLPAGHHLIEVGPKSSDVSEKDVEVSEDKGHKVFWIAQDDTKPLAIIFKKADFPLTLTGEKLPPFQGKVETNGDLIISCKAGDVCKGKINKDLKGKIPPCPQFYYKYYQQLGSDIPADAGIIIEK